MILVPIESAYYDFLIALINSKLVTFVLSCTVSEIRRLLAENCVFFLPVSHSAPPLPMFPLEFRGEVNHEETRVMWWKLHDPNLNRCWLVYPCYRQSDGQTDGRAIAYMLSRAKNHINHITFIFNSSSTTTVHRTSTVGLCFDKSDHQMRYNRAVILKQNWVHRENVNCPLDFYRESTLWVKMRSNAQPDGRPPLYYRRQNFVTNCKTFRCNLQYHGNTISLATDCIDALGFRGIFSWTLYYKFIAKCVSKRILARSSAVVAKVDRPAYDVRNSYRPLSRRVVVSMSIFLVTISN